MSETCEVCGRRAARVEGGCCRQYASVGSGAYGECYCLGYERQRAEIEKLNAELARMDLALGSTKRLMRRLAESEGAAVASSISANTDALSEKQRADAAEAEVLRLTKERDEWKGRADQNETVALADAYQYEREARASAKALREALEEIQRHGYNRHPTNPMDALNSICNCAAPLDCLTTICEIVDRALAPPNPSAEKLTPGPRE